MRQMTDDYINSCWEEIWADLEEEHGSPFSVPIDERNAASEKLRAMNVAQVWQREGGTSSIVSFLNTYSVSDAAIAWFLGKHGKGLNTDESRTKTGDKPVKRKHKWAAFVKWAKENAGTEYTTEQLVAQSGFSYPATLTFVKNEPLFVKVKKGVWRVSTA